MEIDKDKLELIIEKLEGTEQHKAVMSVNAAVLRELKALIEPEKWEPKEYLPNWDTDSSGGVFKSGSSNRAYRAYGNEWPTEELAKTANAMTKRNQLILQAKTEKGFGDGNYEINKGTGEDKSILWGVVQVFKSANPETTFDTKEHGEEVLEMCRLNGG